MQIQYYGGANEDINIIDFGERLKYKIGLL